MLGSVDDAEDVVQEAYLRWHSADAAEIRSAEGWLVAVTTRLSIDRLRRAATEREAYVGQWLPEPLGAAVAPPPPDRAAEIASDLSLAFLVLLERLSPEERAAFILREVFAAEYDEIARVLERSEAAVRQMVHRARDRVRQDRHRFDAPPDAKERLLDRFLRAFAEGDKEELVAVLAPDVVFVADGGGKIASMPEVTTGADRIAELLIGFEKSGRAIVERRGLGPLEHRPATINGEPAILTTVGGKTLFTTSFAVEEGRITGIYRVMNPEKLGHVGPPVLLAAEG